MNVVHFTYVAVWLIHNLFQGATVDVEAEIASSLLEPRLVVFHDDENIQQMFVCAEKTVVLEVPSRVFVDGLIHLMSAYYVFNVNYNFCKSTLYFIQDVLMDMPDKGAHRPTRYSTYINNFIKMD